MEVKEYKKIKYLLDYPHDYNENGKYPIIIFLHGAGCRGNDINILKENPFFKYEAVKTVGAISFSPQCYKDTWFDIYEQLNDFIEFAINIPQADKDRVYLIGASMGGYAVWQLAMSHPEYFAAIVPICGGGMYWNSQKIMNCNIWVFHGKKDNVVMCKESISMVEKIKEFGGRAKLTLLENTYHDAWNYVYNSQEVFDWMKKCKRVNEKNAKNDFSSPSIYG